MNSLEAYFDRHTTGPGLWKWQHYFEIYHRYFAKFIGQKPLVVEVGVYSGGSLGMWKKYFGEGCQIGGIDIQPACMAYAKDGCRVYIGDQGNREFWAEFRQHCPHVDIIIDDGSHKPEDQIVTLEEMLPHLAPGGVYLCEDIHNERNAFAAYLHGLADQLNGWADIYSPHVLAFGATPFQKMVHSIHFYPYIAVIEKHVNPPEKFTAPKHGTEWQPFA